MTNPVVLFGTQSNGETLPVQVDATGRLVAEGLQGQQGEQGEPGPPGLPQLPSGEFEGAVLGWVDGALAWLEPSGLPQPLGIEGQIIQMHNEEAIWVTAPEVPPVYVAPVVLTNDTYLDSNKFGMFDNFGNKPTITTTWDKYAREQPFWTTLKSSSAAGLSYKNAKSITGDFNLENQLARVLEIGVGCKNKCTGGKYGSYPWKLNASASSANLQPIRTEHNYSATPNNYGSTTAKFQWLINRDTVGDFQITITVNGEDVGTAQESWICIQQWDVVDAGRAALNNQMRLQADLERIRRAINS